MGKIPLTAVGKIFKLALRWDATKQVYEKELAGLGDLADSVTVEVGGHKIHGTSATIRIKPAPGADSESIKKRVPEILARYTIHYKMVVEKS